MGNNEFIKWTKFLDDNGAFSIADELENDFVKIAQNKSFERDPNLPEFDENILDRVGNTLNYMGGGLISAFGSRSSLMYGRLANLRSFILSPLAKKDIKFRTYLWNALREAKRAYGDKVDPNVDHKPMTSDLQDATNVEIWNIFGNWVNFCRQLFINHKRAQPFLSELTKAEQYLASLIDPTYKPNVLDSEKKSTIDSQTTTTTPSKPASESLVNREPQPSRKPQAPKKPTAHLMVDWSGSGVQVSNTKPTTEPTIDFE